MLGLSEVSFSSSFMFLLHTDLLVKDDAGVLLAKNAAQPST